MLKLLLILMIGLVFESTGIVLLKKGMTEIAGATTASASEVWRLVKAGATSSNILWGIFFEALFFACLLVLMAKSDISFLWPLTALSFVFATFAAMWFLHEHVSPIRWWGVVLIMLGAALISYSEQTKPRQVAPVAGPATAAATAITDR
jgi:drug/metabolite transporter (DMT)-like permease